ncbi:hypothetical protein BV378_05775 [Nostoc sp. RF31YmG]|nr:hypothetical protein BV378_05775 [Nostoc sp. RF31YmG]
MESDRFFVVFLKFKLLWYIVSVILPQADKLLYTLSKHIKTAPVHRGRIIKNLQVKCGKKLIKF